VSENRNTTPPAAAGIFSAADIKRRMAEIEAAKAAEEMRRLQAQEEQQKKVMAEFQQPPARTAEQLLPLVMQLVSRAAERGQSEIQVYRFPKRGVHRSRPSHQQLGSRLGADLGGPPQGRV
jgi:hypothetical protein